MKKSVILFSLLVGCSTVPEPYPIKPQSVTVNFLSESEWLSFTTHRTLNGSWGLPGDINGTARITTNENGDVIDCEIFFPAGDPPSPYTLSHEMRHCTDGHFH